MTIAALIFIVLMVGSSIAFTFIQASQLGLTGGSSQVTLPSTSIIDYELSLDQEQLALQKGMTIIKYSYSSTCTQCLTVVNQLEGVANQFNTQVYLENLASQSANDASVLTFTSSQNSKIYNNPTTNNIIDGLCAALIQPPIECTLRNINTSGSSAGT
jgi:hypothetical protein